MSPPDLIPAEGTAPRFRAATERLIARVALALSALVAAAALLGAAAIGWRVSHSLETTVLRPRIPAHAEALALDSPETEARFEGHPWIAASPTGCVHPLPVDDNEALDHPNRSADVTAECWVGPSKFSRVNYGTSGPMGAERWNSLPPLPHFECFSFPENPQRFIAPGLQRPLQFRSNPAAGMFAWRCGEPQLSQTNDLVRYSAIAVHLTPAEPIDSPARRVRVRRPRISLKVATVTMGTTLALLVALAVWRRRHPPRPDSAYLLRPWRAGEVTEAGEVVVPGVGVLAPPTPGLRPGPVLVELSPEIDPVGPYRPHAPEVVNAYAGTLDTLHDAVARASREHAVSTLLGALGACLPVLVVLRAWW